MEEMWLQNIRSPKTKEWMKEVEKLDLEDLDNEDSRKRRGTD